MYVKNYNKNIYFMFPYMWVILCPRRAQASHKQVGWGTFSALGACA